MDFEPGFLAGDTILGVHHVEDFTVNVLRMGGFGRRSPPDVASEAVKIAQQFDVPVQMIWSKLMFKSLTRSMESWRTWRLCKPYFRLSSSVQRTLVALKSMPVTRAAGQRKACLAA